MATTWVNWPDRSRIGKIWIFKAKRRPVSESLARVPSHGTPLRMAVRICCAWPSRCRAGRLSKALTPTMAAGSVPVTRAKLVFTYSTTPSASVMRIRAGA